LTALAHEVQQAGGQALPIEADMADFDQVNEAANRLEEALGPIDVWSMCLRVGVRTFTQIEPDEFRRVTE